MKKNIQKTIAVLGAAVLATGMVGVVPAIQIQVQQTQAQTAAQLKVVQQQIQPRTAQIQKI